MKKNDPKQSHRRCPMLKKLLIIMKLTTVLFFLALFQVSAKSYSQETRLNLKFDKETLENVFSKIEANSEFSIFYKDELIKNSKEVTGEFKHLLISEILDQILKSEDLSYTVMDKLIMIVPKEYSAIKNIMQQSDKKVKGKVTDQTGVPIPGAAIIVKGTTIGVTSDNDGNFSLSLPSEAKILVFSFVGMLPQEIAIGNKTTINVEMQDETIGIEEVVAVGYGTQKKVNLTGAVSSIKGDLIAERPVSNSVLALQGVAPGLSVVNRGGAPGASDVTIRIRGTGTLNNSNPLVLVDGVPQSLENIPTSEIESISILKDAASSSIYGSRAGNGVIIVTTKRGINEGLSVSYNNSYGLQNKTFWPKSASPVDYIQLANEAYENSGMAAPYSDEYISNVKAGTNPLKFPFYNYVPEVFNDNALQQNHSLSVSSGGKRGKILVSLDYLNQDAIVKKHNFERYSIRINSDLYINKKLTFSSDLMYRKRKYTGVGRTVAEIFQSILNSKQTVVGQYPNGSYDLVGGLRNPRAILNESGFNHKFSDDIVGTVGLKYDIVAGLSVKGSLSVNNTADENRLYQKKLEMTDYFTGEPIPVGALWAKNYLEESRAQTNEVNYKIYADYDRKFGHSDFKILLGYDEIHNNYRNLGASRDNFYSNAIQEIDAGDASNWKNWGNSTEWRLRSFFSRLNYSFKDKYLLEANLRLDGSSRFSKGKKYGLFPSISAGWRVEQEEFLKNSQVISNLKIRGSWGQLGNQEIPLYRNVGVYNLTQGYNFNNNIVSGAAQIVAANPNITWESTTMTDLGFDLGLFKGKVSMVADYFWRKTNDILFALPIAPSIGISAPTQNAASVENNGWEFSVNYNGNNEGSDFTYTIGFNISDVINKITDLKGTGPYYRDKFNIWQEGQSINTLYGYKTLGLYRTQEDLVKYPKVTNEVTLGDIIYSDVNKDGVINANDRVIIGNMDPRFSIGINFGANYKGFDFSMLWQGVLKSQVNIDGAIIEGPDWENYTTEDMAKNRYHVTKNPNGTMPRVAYGQAVNGYVSDFWLQNTRYLRLKNFQLGYTLSKSLTEKLKIQKIRIFISGENQLTFTSAKWVDPEVPAGRLQYFPQSKVMTTGINVTF